ncbi:hypothetical protein EV385_4370 [Krasilnikovia cinnamomea]|uniref:Uncharacterized protein n=1 Tax=Krasilnikovia cinnamomea TaxID=349313 RepID=A0A4Q7ZP65_9ACTN|nr:hypothetical protein [Krasilnikovia cinnamomea]RZU52504.1 hypothetical protein EV385_4370 [Krasilnikovia cinnamomea]
MSETDSVATTAITVQRGAWASVCPALPPELAEMVAPPVVVTLGPVGTDAVPADADEDAAPGGPRHAAPGQPRPSSAPGRHRSAARAN